MTRLILAAGVAALAITVPATADPGKNAGGKGRDAHSQHAQKQGGAKVQRVESRRTAAKARDRSEQRASRIVERRSKGVEKSLDRRAKQANRAVERQDRQLDRIADRRERQLERVADRRDVLRVRDLDGRTAFGYGVDGCPPGLAKKPVECVPPGQVKNIIGTPLSALSQRLTLNELPVRLRSVYRDTPEYYYRYGNGYAYRVDRSDDLVSALIPLFGLGYSVGQPFPSAYSNSFLPMGLQSFYPSTANMSYRYANGYVYGVDPMSGLIADVNPMLGYGYGYGQMMPATYSAYNVPYQYRSLYADSSDQYYRYAPGAIYQVDPTTSLITAVSALLTGGMNVGQPLPVGYSAYNVPMQYRSTYFDTPDTWHRYSNGYIYQVDPRTQLITAIVASALT